MKIKRNFIVTTMVSILMFSSNLMASSDTYDVTTGNSTHLKYIEGYLGKGSDWGNPRGFIDFLLTSDIHVSVPGEPVVNSIYVYGIDSSRTTFFTCNINSNDHRYKSMESALHAATSTSFINFVVRNSDPDNKCVRIRVFN